MTSIQVHTHNRPSLEVYIYIVLSKLWLQWLQIHGYEIRKHTRIGEKDALTAVLLHAPLQSSSLFFLPITNLTMHFLRYSYVYGPLTNESVAHYKQGRQIESQ